MTLHKDSPLGQQHKAHNWEYSNATTRGAAAGFVTADIGKLALQTDDYSLWILTAITPTWTSAGSLASGIHGATAKTPIVDADEIAIADSAASWGLKKVTWVNLKAAAKTYFDTLYPLEVATVIVASAATTPIGAAASSNVDISGNISIVAFDNVVEGINRKGRFTGILTLTHNATSLILPGVANITTAANDRYEARSLGNGNWIVTKYERADGSAVAVTDKIQPITASVASNALTITLNPTILDFRSATIGSGAIATVSNASPISVVVPSTATLGTVSAVQSRLVILAINNAGTMELAVANISGGSALDETGIISTTLIAAASNSATLYYSPTARTGVAYRVVGYVESTQAIAGTWTTTPSTLQGYGGNALIKTALNATGGAPIYACRAWVNFNGTGTVAIRGSGNVSSITDNGVGNYTVNFTTAMGDANYAAICSRDVSDFTGGLTAGTQTLTTSTCGVRTQSYSTGVADVATITFAVFR